MNIIKIRRPESYLVWDKNSLELYPQLYYVNLHLSLDMVGWRTSSIRRQHELPKVSFLYQLGRFLYHIYVC